jgi:hypothetical protein
MFIFLVKLLIIRSTTRSTTIFARFAGGMLLVLLFLGRLVTILVLQYIYLLTQHAMEKFTKVLKLWHDRFIPLRIILLYEIRLFLIIILFD